MKIYKSQINNKYYSRSVEAAKSLANFRGSQNGFKYAEAFQIIRKLNWFNQIIVNENFISNYLT